MMKQNSFKFHSLDVNIIMIKEISYKKLNIEKTELYEGKVLRCPNKEKKINKIFFFKYLY